MRRVDIALSEGAAAGAAPPVSSPAEAVYFQSHGHGPAASILEGLSGPSYCAITWLPKKALFLWFALNKYLLHLQQKREFYFSL